MVEAPPSPVSTRRRRRWPQLLIGLGLILLAIVLLLAALTLRPGNPAPLPIPVQIADLPLRGHLFGPEAAEEIQRLHRSRFPLTGAAIAIYGADPPEAMIWVARTWGDLGARLLTAWMTRAIERSDNSPFTPTGQRQVQNIRIYELTGMGQIHYYFQIGDRVYWLAVNPDQADQGLQDLLQFALASEQGATGAPDLTQPG